MHTSLELNRARTTAEAVPPTARPSRTRSRRRSVVLAALALGVTATGGFAAPASASVPDDAFVSDAGAVVRTSGALRTGVVIEGAAAARQAATGGESILGKDTRTPVTDTSTYPAWAIGFITKNGAPHCTGWLISKDTVVTAGHCVHPGGAGKSFFSGLQFWPGRDGADPRWGSCTARSGGLFAPSGWTTDANEEYDLATIKLTCSTGNTVGWFGLWAQDASYTGFAMRIQGYPSDKPQTQWQSTGIVSTSGPRQLFYGNDTLNGMSGSPVFRTGNQPGCGQTACAAAIHTYGVHGSGDHVKYNHGTRITPTRANQLRQIAAAP